MPWELQPTAITCVATIMLGGQGWGGGLGGRLLIPDPSVLICNPRTSPSVNGACCHGRISPPPRESETPSRTILAFGVPVAFSVDVGSLVSRVLRGCRSSGWFQMFLQQTQHLEARATGKSPTPDPTNSLPHYWPMPNLQLSSYYMLVCFTNMANDRTLYIRGRETTRGDCGGADLK